jgi:hypothetical protein
VRDIQQLQPFLRAAAATGREGIRVPPFDAFFDPSDDLRYLNYAVPDDGAAPGADDIDALRSAFRQRDRLPRLEWIAEAAPAVADALAEAAMAEELATPLMACTRAELRTPEAEAEISPVTPAEALAVRNMQRTAR